MMSGNCTSKKELLQSIDQVSFAIDDLLLPEEMNFWKNMQNFMVR